MRREERKRDGWTDDSRDDLLLRSGTVDWHAA